VVSAVAHGPRVVGVILSGVLDDGTAGLVAIKAARGAAVVQDPEDALHPGMALSALANVAVDAVAPVRDLAGIVAGLVGDARGEAPREPVGRSEQPALAETADGLQER
jgi:two-component system chemotaxis response regulator CheB